MQFFVLKNGGVTSPRGFRVGVTRSGLRYKRYDLALLITDCPAVGAGVFTTNKFAAAPVQVSRQHLRQGEKMRGFVVNSGCANACTGERGLHDAQQMTQLAGEVTGFTAAEFFVASTGVIGDFLPMEKVAGGIREAGQNLSPEKGRMAAEAIMTTDIVPKEIAIKVEIAGKEVTIGAMAKGSGMIHPQMATMLAFITTDVLISQECLQKALQLANEDSFNLITVDGDTSTNDSVIALANGLAGNEPLVDEHGVDFSVFVQALKRVCVFLAKMIARDGEGATKLIEVHVKNAFSLAEARRAARTIAGSSLLKAAISGEDANWGRILCALGYAAVNFVPTDVAVYLEELTIVQDGCGVVFEEAFAQKILAQKEIVFTVDLKAGSFAATAWGCDLTEEYVRINAHYRT